jgi:exonuclease III
MKPMILSWNVRGLNERSKRLRISDLIRDWKVDIVCFQETKLHSLSCSIVRSLWGCNHVDWVCLDSSGTSGGILIMWDKKVVEKVDECVGVYTLVVSFRSIVDRTVWTFACVYGSNFGSDRRLLWDKLAGILNWWNMLGGGL